MSIEMTEGHSPRSIDRLYDEYQDWEEYGVLRPSDYARCTGTRPVPDMLALCITVRAENAHLNEWYGLAKKGIAYRDESMVILSLKRINEVYERVQNTYQSVIPFLGESNSGQSYTREVERFKANKKKMVSEIVYLMPSRIDEKHLSATFSGHDNFDHIGSKCLGTSFVRQRDGAKEETRCMTENIQPWQGTRRHERDGGPKTSHKRPEGEWGWKTRNGQRKVGDECPFTVDASCMGTASFSFQHPNI